ncbi:SRPBCC domain-containing protein [Microbacterium abyssi]|uniref:SRPBCC domain-containing protein n=1 Tax=Microbacterium abyssi TaxID=2782166 RepID=UPI0018872AF2|nr:SRPBCC domain-containing protein [Microbacterium sp. A18JL241]
MVSTTQNPAAVVDEDTFSIRRTIRVAASIDKVWQVVAEPAHISRWFGRTELNGTGVGATGTVTFPDTEPFSLRVEAREERRLIAYRWNNDDAYRDAHGGSVGDHADPLAEDRTTVFTFTLEEVDGGTQLTVVEAGFEHTSDPAVNLESHRTGWTEELDKLVVLLESAA